MNTGICQCTTECTDTTQSSFAPGHDAKYRERMLALLRSGQLSITEVFHLTVDNLHMPGLFRQIREKLELHEVR